MQNKHLLVGGAKCNRAGGLPGAVGPCSHPVDTQSSRSCVFLEQFSTEAGKSALFLIAQALDSSVAGVLLMPHQFLSIRCAWRGADPALWGGAGQAKLETLFSVLPTWTLLNMLEQAYEQTLVVSAFREMVYFFYVPANPHYLSNCMNKLLCWKAACERRACSARSFSGLPCFPKPVRVGF